MLRSEFPEADRFHADLSKCGGHLAPGALGGIITSSNPISQRGDLPRVRLREWVFSWRAELPTALPLVNVGILTPSRCHATLRATETVRNSLRLTPATLRGFPYSKIARSTHGQGGQPSPMLYGRSTD